MLKAALSLHHLEKMLLVFGLWRLLLWLLTLMEHASETYTCCIQAPSWQSLSHLS